MSEQEIYIEAINRRDPAERRRFLDEVCAGNEVLRGRIETLIRQSDQLGSFLENSPQPLGATADTSVAVEKSGTQIGPYKLLQQIGEGGMGTVFMAEQSHPVHRKVALKLIKPGMDSRQVIARFEAERQALAMMDHVNIARVFDGGATENGRPYFVMELVHGVPITKYCDDNHLTPRQRLELFVPVCQAMQHAHQKGIIHRDIKPSNVMVTLYDGKPVPKVIDFGVAKATEQKLTERTLFTQYGTMVGTLEYMSPEQAEMNALGVDTRSDIYSLGVLLYELLTGSTPLTHKRMKEVAYAEILRMIKEEEPPKPSTRLSDSGEALASISANRHTEPAKLTKLVRGELDWIVMKTLEKDRNRRYETAKEFAADVQRYLADEPVQACPPSTWYRLRKFARRNKAAIGVAGMVLFFLVLLGSGAGWAVRDRAAREAESTRERTERQAKVAGQVELIVTEVDRLEREQKWAEALAAARRAEAAVTGGEADAATAQRVRALLKDLEFIDRLEQIRMQCATIVEGKVDYAGADREYARAFRNYGVDVEELAIETSIERLKARSALAIPLAAALDDWVSVQRVVSTVDAAGWKRLVAVARGIDPEPLRDRLRSTWGQPMSEGQDELRRLADSIDIRAQHPATLVSLARTLTRTKQADSAIRILRHAQHVNPGDFWLCFELGFALIKQGDHEGAIRYYTAAVSIRPNSAAAHTNLGTALAKQKKLDEAIACYRKAIELDPKYAAAHNDLGIALTDQGKLDEAIAAYHRAIEIDPKDGYAHYNLGIVLKAQGKLDEAIACYRKAIEVAKFAAVHIGLGNALSEQKKLDEAIAAYRTAIEIYPKSVNAHIGLGNALREQKKLDEAIAAYRQVIEIDPKATHAYTGLGIALGGQNKLDEAIAAFNKAIEIEPKYADAYYGLGNVLRAQNKLDEAIAIYRKLIEVNLKDAESHFTLAIALRDQKNLDEAIAAFRQAIEVDPKYGQAYTFLGLALRDQKKWDEEIAVYRKAIEVIPNYSSAYYNLGVTLERQKKPDEAIAVYRQGLQRLPDEAGLHRQLAHVLWKQRRLEEAAASFRQAIQLNPPADNFYLYYYLGCVLNEQKKPKEAVDAVRKAIDINSKYAPAHYQLGLALGALGQDAESIACYRKATEIDPKNTSAHAALGNALVAQKDFAGAAAAFQEAAALVPNIATYWKSLGVAHYRAENWKAAVEALEKRRQINSRLGKDSVILFFLSMAHGQLNEKEQARTFYDEAVQWRMGIGATEEELRRLCAEAADLLDLEVPPTLKDPPVLTPGPGLLKPAPGAILDNGTSDHSKSRVWEFDWSDVPGATQYHLYANLATGNIPIINTPALTSSSYRYGSTGYIEDPSRLSPRWKVRAQVQGIWTDWSEERTFEVAPPGNNQPASPKK